MYINKEKYFISYSPIPPKSLSLRNVILSVPLYVAEIEEIKQTKSFY